MKRINLDRLRPGDIILTARTTKVGKTVRLTTKGQVSHAMIYVQYGSIIDSTPNGVQARNLQREFFDDSEKVFGFRLREEISPEKIANVINFARGETGARYSKTEAVRAVLRVKKSRNKRQFCSRLVARAYGSIGIHLVADEDYCTPEELRLSPLLRELSDLTEEVTVDEIDIIQRVPDLTKATHDSQNYILNVARRLDPNVESFNDLNSLLQKHPEHDAILAEAYKNSGYLTLWQIDFDNHPYRYDVDLMEAASKPEDLIDLRKYCIETIREAYSGSLRFAINLRHYQHLQRSGSRETLKLLIQLYKTLVSNDQLRRETARSWLLRHYPKDVELYMERITPHTDQWFSIVDLVEPMLGIVARASIEREGSLEVCSSCGDPPNDYRLVNSANKMPGVPSLRLCRDCVEIRRAGGEVLEVIN